MSLLDEHACDGRAGFVGGAANHLRPSMLPKLAQCSHYRPDVAGEAAERGTRMDEVFRAMIQNQNVSVKGLDEEDRDALMWAHETARVLACGDKLVADESKLKIECMGMTGTADLLCEDAGWSADLKTGQRRNYVEQQAAYAIGFMDIHFCEEWTVYLIYCDLREVETLRFTRDEAEKIVRNVIAKFRSNSAPEVNEYCGWCSQRFSCPARREELAIIPVGEPLDESMDRASSRQLREFAMRCDTVEDFGKKAREILKARCAGGEKIPGVSLTSRRGARKVPAEALLPAAIAKGTGVLLSLLPDVSEERAKNAWEGMEAPFPADKVVEMPGSSFVRISKPKVENLEGGK